MKFRIRVCFLGRRITERNPAWWEPYDKNVDDPEKWARDTIDRFNANRQLGERGRQLLRVEVEIEKK